MYYQLYSDNYEIPSKVANDPEEPSIGRIRADSIPPPHTPTSIKLYISRVEGKPELVNSDLFLDTISHSPLEDGLISILHSDGPGLSPDDPMSIVQTDVQVKSPQLVEVTSVPEGRYLIKNRGEEIYFNWGFWGYWGMSDNIKKVHFNFYPTRESGMNFYNMQVKSFLQLF